MNKIILTDCDGVLLNWEWAFCIWMEQHGYTQIPDGNQQYDIAKRFNIPSEKGKELACRFNESAAIGFLPALRDSIYYVKRLHEEHGYEFHCITSLSLDPSAKKLRPMNLGKMFGPTAFTVLECLDTGADKDEALAPYADSGLLWIEDKPENAVVGYNLGLESILIEHGHNMDFEHPHITTVKGWKEIYELCAN